jgi:predicted Zn finger-like uncharacterized protein
MTLAARCPHCEASFRVVADQLKLRGGLVRCGECRQVFDAIATLTIVEDSAPEAAPAEVKRDLAPVPTGTETETETESLAEAGPATALQDQVPAQARHAEPEFLRPRRRFGAWATAGWSTVAALLAIVLTAQLSVAFSSELAGRWPALRPALIELCRQADCKVEWPRRPEALTLMGVDLEALPGTDALELSGTLRNRADLTVAAPAIEVTLAEADSRIAVRKVFFPAEYLSDRERGIEAGGELEFKIGFAAPGVKPESFVAYPFYPD